MVNINYDNDTEIMNAIVKNGELPRYIYKYMSMETAKIVLENNSIRFSKPPLFNDPFDCQLTIDTGNTDEEVDGYVNQIAKTKGLSAHQKEEYRIKLRNPNVRFQITNNSIQQAINSMKISCFSTAYDNLLMWAHYANKHYGVVMKFDVLKDASFFMVPYPVNYTKEYPVFNYLRDDYYKGGGQIAPLLTKTKSSEWEYEKEVRIMKPDTDIHNPSDYQLFPIKKEAIIEIILGCQISDEQKKEFVYFAKNKGWNNLVFKQSKKKSWEFGLDFFAY